VTGGSRRPSAVRVAGGRRRSPGAGREHSSSSTPGDDLGLLVQPPVTEHVPQRARPPRRAGPAPRRRAAPSAPRRSPRRTWCTVRGVTTRVQPVSRQSPAAAAAARMATISAWGRGGPRQPRAGLCPRPVIVPAASTTTAPTGTSGSCPARGRRRFRERGTPWRARRKAAYPVVTAQALASRAEGSVQGPVQRLAEAEPAGDTGQGLVRETGPGRRTSAPEIHLVHAEVGEDGHLPRRQHLVQVVVVGDRDLEKLQHLAGQRPVPRRPVRSDRNTETSPPSTRSATKKSSPTAARPNRPRRGWAAGGARGSGPSGPRWSATGQDFGVPGVHPPGRRSRRRLPPFTSVIATSPGLSAKQGNGVRSAASPSANPQARQEPAGAGEISLPKAVRCAPIVTSVTNGGTHGTATRQFSVPGGA